MEKVPKTDKGKIILARMVMYDGGEAHRKAREQALLAGQPKVAGADDQGWIAQDRTKCI